VVGPATLHRRMADEYAVESELAVADMELLVPLRNSPEYRAIRPRLTDLQPVESWLEDGLHFFVFGLLAIDGRDLNGDAPTAVIAMHPESVEPVSAIVVTPEPGGHEAEIVDLRVPGWTYTAPLPPQEGHAAEKSDNGAAPDEVNLPPALRMLLLLLHQSPVGEAISDRLVDGVPTDVWQEDGLTFLAFELLPVDGATSLTEPPTAVFAVHPQSLLLISAVVVTPDPAGGEPEIADLKEQLQPAHTATLSEEEQGESGEADPSLNGDRATHEVAFQPERAVEESAETGATSLPVHEVKEARSAAKAAVGEGRIDHPHGGQADGRSLAAIEDSDEYRAIQSRLTVPWPVDSWQEDGLHFFVFELRAADDADPAPEPPTAVFVIRPDPVEVVAAVVVTPRAPEISNLKQTESIHSPVLIGERAPTEAVDSDRHASRRKSRNLSAPENPALLAEPSTRTRRTRAKISDQSEPTNPPLLVDADAPAQAMQQAEGPRLPADTDAGEGATDDRQRGPETGLLATIKSSDEYRVVLDRLANPEPVDSWPEDGLTFFVFQLRPDEDAEVAIDPPVAVFAMHPELAEPVSAVVVMPGLDLEAPGIADLRRPA
jgi:hypothetical protein